MIHTTTPRGRESGELLQQMDQNTLVKRVFTKKFDISGWRIADGVDQGPQVYALLHSNSSYNLTGFSTPETDKLADEMRTAPDAELRQSLQCKIAEVFNDQAFISYRGGGRYFAFSRKRVKNLPVNWRGLIDVTSVWVEQ
jgi:4-phytase/acid phosphatase/peptide/nickel transport system substrate-binding protein